MTYFLIFAAAFVLTIAECVLIFRWNPGYKRGYTIGRLEAQYDAAHEHDKGYFQGLREGYVKGRQDAHDWWGEMDKEVELEFLKVKKMGGKMQ